jgi:hypothetical protein
VAPLAGVSVAASASGPPGRSSSVSAGVAAIVGTRPAPGVIVSAIVALRVAVLLVRSGSPPDVVVSRAVALTDSTTSPALPAGGVRTRPASCAGVSV